MSHVLSFVDDWTSLAIYTDALKSSVLDFVKSRAPLSSTWRPLRETWPRTLTSSRLLRLSLRRLRSWIAVWLLPTYVLLNWCHWCHWLECPHTPLNTNTHFSSLPSTMLLSPLRALATRASTTMPCSACSVCQCSSDGTLVAAGRP